MKLINKLKHFSFNRPNEHAVVLKKKNIIYLEILLFFSLLFKKNKYSKVCILEDKERFFTYIYVCNFAV